MKRDFLITLDLPKWARWYAVDNNGEVWIYDERPERDCMGEPLWVGFGGRCEFAFKLNTELILNFDWTQTLHEIER